MSNVRTVIELLLQILRENGSLKLKAEIFRLGKFNDDAAVEPLWHLLFELLYFCHYGSIEDVSVRAWMEMKKEEVVVYVKRELRNLGFLSADLAALPRDMSHGSRELLLALGWLLCKQDVVQRFMLNATSPLAPAPDAWQSERVQQSDDPQLSLESPNCAADRVKQLLWFNNKLQLSLRTLLSQQQHAGRLQHQIHASTLGCAGGGDRKHLSMFEVYMLRHPELLKKNIALLEKDNERLQHLLRWQDSEDVFWKWMESVLDEKQKSSEQQECDVTLPAHVTALSRDCAVRMRRCHDDLQDAILKYEAVVENLEQLWEAKASDVTEEELNSVLSALDLELSIQQASIQLNSAEQGLYTSPQPDLVYRPKPSVSKASLASTGYSSQGSTSPNNNAVADIQDEIWALERRVDELQLQLEARQRGFKTELQEIASRFTQAVCIPPLNQ